MTHQLADSPIHAVQEAFNDSAYLKWLRDQELSPLVTQYVPDLRELELSPWIRCGGRVRYVNHGSSHRTNDLYVSEIPPGHSQGPERHIFEETIFVLDGRGSTVIRNDKGDSQSFEWQAGSLFAMPLNTWHEHHNLSGTTPVRFVVVSTAPQVLNLFADPEFIFNCEYDFLDRFNRGSSFDEGGELEGRVLKSNFVADVRMLKLLEHRERGAGGTTMKFRLGGNTTWAHTSEFPVGTYKKAHRHAPGANIIVISGEGYSLMWHEGEEPKRYDWKVGSLVIPMDRGFHQHFNTGPEPARYLALGHTRERHPSGLRPGAISTRFGGDQINYADEAPIVQEMYREALAVNGVEFQMDEFYKEENDLFA